MGSHENYLADLRVTMPLFTGGKLSNQIRAQKQHYYIKSHTLESQRLNLAYLTRRAYLNALLSESMLIASQSSLKRVQIIKKDVGNLYASGLADSIDILESELGYYKTQKAQNEIATIKYNAELTLARFLGLGPNADLDLIGEFPRPMTYQFSQAHDSLASQRPELKISQSRMELARAIYNSGRSGYLPNLSAFGSYVYGKPNKDLIDKSWNDYYIYGLNLSWEFNLGIKTARSVSAARYQNDSARKIYKETEESLKLAIRLAESNLRLAFENFEISSKEFGIAEEKFRLASMQFQAGKLSSNRLLEIEEELTASEQSFRASLINYYLAETEYLYAAGSSRIYGGF
jgi:outer membrane protein TolC